MSNIVNPNVIVRNCFEKVTNKEVNKSILGAPDVTIDTTNFNYLIISLDVISTTTGAYIRVSNSDKTVHYTIYDLLTKANVPMRNSNSGIDLSNPNSSYYLYVDVTGLNDVKVTLRSNPAMVVNYTIGLSNILPEHKTIEPFYTLVKSETLSSDLQFKFRNSSKYVEVLVNKEDSDYCASDIRLYDEDRSEYIPLKCVLTGEKASNTSLKISCSGLNVYYADVSTNKNITLKVSRNGFTPTLTIKMKSTDVLDKEIFEKTVLNIPNSPILIEYERAITACWNEWKVYVSDDGHLLRIWNTRNAYVREIPDVSAVFGSGVYIDMSNYGTHEIKLIPYPYNNSPSGNTNNNNAYVGLTLKTTEGKFLFHRLETDASSSSNWKEVKFWEKPDTNRKIPTKNASTAQSDSDHFRYDTTLPDELYLHTDISTSGLIEYQDAVRLRTLGCMAVNKKMAVLAQYDTEGYRVNLWGTSDGGQNFVSLFDFSPSKRIYATLPSSVKKSINTSGFSTYNNDLNMYKVTRNYPSVSDKEPSHPYTLSASISVDSISSAAQCVVTKTAHGLESGDIVVFESNGNTDWSQLASSGFSADSLGDNAYYIEKIDNNSFYLKYFLGSYDTNLTCRHIHSVNATNYGFLFCTGEQYPNGWELYLEQNVRDGYVDVMTQKFNIYRLNSSENSVQRCCGALLTADKEPDLIVFEDETSVFDNTATFEIDGREETLAKNSSYGVWKGKLSKIDSFYDDFERIAASPEPSIWMYQIGNLVVNYLQQGGLMVSTDNCKTFTYISNVGNSLVKNPNMFNGVTDNCICFSNGYIIKMK